MCKLKTSFPFLNKVKLTRAKEKIKKHINTNDK